MMKKPIPVAALVAALACVVAAPASADESHHVAGIQSPPLTAGPDDPCPSATAFAANAMAGSLIGCWYTDTFVVTKDTTTNGTEELHAIGTEHFVGCLDRNGDGRCTGGDPRGTLAFTYTLTAWFDAATGKEIRGGCHHPIVAGTGDFAEATGVVNFADNVTNGTSAYRGRIDL